MDVINCKLINIRCINESEMIMMRIFGLVSPDSEDTVIFHGNKYYCIANVNKDFNIHELIKLEESEWISKHKKNEIKLAYLQICTYAYLFNKSKKCIINSSRILVVYDMSSEDVSNIFNNSKLTFSPEIVTKLIKKVETSLLGLKLHSFIDSDSYSELYRKFHEQLQKDNLLSEADIRNSGVCGYCGGPCDSRSQTCHCYRRKIYDFSDIARSLDVDVDMDIDSE